jgi:hypothetical protein
MNFGSVRRAVVGPLVVLAAACGADKDTPAPTPVTTTTTVPAAAATPRPFVCPLPALPDLHIQCPKLSPELSGYVNNAIEAVIAKRPELFDFNNNLGPGSWKVLDRQKYVDAVVSAIHDQGICAKDDNEELAIKNTNAFNEQYNIWTSGGYVRRAYITTCFPAQF